MRQILLVFEFFSWSSAGVITAASSAASNGNSGELELLSRSAYCACEPLWFEMKQMESKQNLLEVGLARDVQNHNSQMGLSSLKILILVPWNCSENFNSFIIF